MLLFLKGEEIKGAGAQQDSMKGEGRKGGGRSIIRQKRRKDRNIGGGEQKPAEVKGNGASNEGNEPSGRRVMLEEARG